MTSSVPAGGFLAPAYHDRSLSDVVPAIARALGTPLEDGSVGGEAVGAAWQLPPAPAYVLFLVDGLGELLLRRHAHAAPFLSSLLTAHGSATAGVPSTTATSLASLGTGLAPGGHGLVGFTSRVPGTDRLLNALFWDRTIDPRAWQPHPTAFDRLQRLGVHVANVNKREFAESGLTIAAHRGADFVGADRVGERIAGVLESAARRPSLTYVYDGDLDWTGHRYGVASAHWLQQLAMVDAEAEQLREALPADVRLVVVADHGMVDCSPEDRIDIDEHPQLRDGLYLLAGEARFRHLYCAARARDDLAATWRETLRDRAEVLTREEAIERGWFGAVDDAVMSRLGDVVVAATGSFGVFSSVDFAYETRLIGLHGSLTRDAMLIPLLVC